MNRESTVESILRNENDGNFLCDFPFRGWITTAMCIHSNRLTCKCLLRLFYRDFMTVNFMHWLSPVKLRFLSLSLSLSHPLRSSAWERLLNRRTTHMDRVTEKASHSCRFSAWAHAEDEGKKVICVFDRARRIDDSGTGHIRSDSPRYEWIVCHSSSAPATCAHLFKWSTIDDDDDNEIVWINKIEETWDIGTNAPSPPCHIHRIQYHRIDNNWRYNRTPTHTHIHSQWFRPFHDTNVVNWIFVHSVNWSAAVLITRQYK